MGKRKRGRSVKNNKNVVSEPDDLVQAPHSFVIHRGLPRGNVVELTKDFRKIMEPFTATSLKERKKNTIKDFVSISGLMHVSHLCIFSRTDLGMYLKICRLPRGPTLTFKIHNFSLVRDVISSLKKQVVSENAYKHSPLVVLNSFSGEGRQMKLMATTFQNMFPTINLTSVDLSNISRCVMLNYNPSTKLIDFRHYIIKVIPIGVSKGVKKVVQGRVPNLAKCNDIAEFLTTTSMLSESEFEDDPNTHVTLSQKLISRGNIEQGKSAIRLSELGPRLTLQLIKIEDGLLDGEVLYHELVCKTEEEKLAIQKSRDSKRKLKEKRKKIQEDNKKRKDTEKEVLKQKSLKGMQKAGTDASSAAKEEEEEGTREMVVEEDDDAEYYRQEVGEEPDKDLFTRRQFGTKRPARTAPSFKNKKAKLDVQSGNEKSYGNKKRLFNKSKDKEFGAHKFNKSKNRDKTNSQNRDFRPIGGAHGGSFPKNRNRSKVMGSNVSKSKRRR